MKIKFVFLYKNHVNIIQKSKFSFLFKNFYHKSQELFCNFKKYICKATHVYSIWINKKKLYFIKINLMHECCNSTKV